MGLHVKHSTDSDHCSNFLPLDFATCWALGEDVARRGGRRLGRDAITFTRTPATDARRPRVPGGLTLMPAPDVAVTLAFEV